MNRFSDSVRTATLLVVFLLTSDSLNMEAGKNILGDSDGEQQACSTGDTLADSDDEDQRIIFSNSAYRPIKSLAESSPSFPQSQVLSPPPFLPTSSPGWSPPSSPPSTGQAWSKITTWSKTGRERRRMQQQKVRITSWAYHQKKIGISNYAECFLGPFYGRN